MKYSYPKSITLDVKDVSTQLNNDYWIFSYSNSFSKQGYFHTTLSLISSRSSITSKSTLSTPSSTVSFSSDSTQAIFTKKQPQMLTSKVKKLRSLKTNAANSWSFKPSSEVCEPNYAAPHTGPEYLDAQKIYDHSSKPEGSNLLKNRSLLHHLFDINFIKKERLYTKLKYSRSPAYDIVSGGSAALLAGFIGFLISEKFGIELVDSGDFYIGFMYVVFLALSCRPLLKMMSQTTNLWSIISPNYLFNYLNNILTLVVSFVGGLYTQICDKKFTVISNSNFSSVSRDSNFRLLVLIWIVVLLI